MAVALLNGEYALQQDRGKKIVLQLKLTDSALRAVDVYQEDAQVVRKAKPTITFDGNQGVICIPATERQESQNFTFQLSLQNQSASIDCLQQHGGRPLQCSVSVLGEVNQKITVHAKDDSYSTTKKRIEIVKELEKTISTKVIKQPGSKLGKKQLFRRKVFEQKQTRLLPPGRTSTPPPRRNVSFPRSTSPMNLTSRSLSPSPGADVAGVRQKTKPILSSFSASSKHSTTSSVASKHLHEKILHYLALRPMKLQDLITRLSSSKSSTTIDVSKIQSILQLISSSHAQRPGVTEYSLSKNRYNDVRFDWPGYSDEEKNLIKRKLSEIMGNNNKKRSAESAGRLSPCLTTQNLEEESYSIPVQKKQRVSLYKHNKTSSHRPRSVSPLESSSTLLTDTDKTVGVLNNSSVLELKEADMNRLGLSPSKHSRKRPANVNSNKNNKFSNTDRISPLTTNLPPLEDSFVSASFNTVTTDANLSKEKNSSFTSTSSNSIRNKKDESSDKMSRRQTSHKTSLTDVSVSLSSPDQQKGVSFGKDEFLQKYRPINCVVQRNQYKSDFTAEYKEYLALHEKVVSQLKRFADWQTELAQQECGTEQYKKITRQVYAEYTRLKENEKFHKERNRRDYLHRKLKHIKKMVLEYDSKQFSRPEVARRTVLTA